jgi:hypothetical protein
VVHCCEAEEEDESPAINCFIDSKPVAGNCSMLNEPLRCGAALRLSA